MQSQNCPHCHSRLQPDDTVFCMPCYLSLLEQHTWPWVEQLFAYCEAALDEETAQAQVEAFRMAWEPWTATLPAIHAASNPPIKSLAQCVEKARQAWSAFRHAEKQYVARTRTISVATEFMLLLHLAKDMRQISRESLLEAFCYDVESGRPLREARAVSTAKEADEFIQSVQCYAIFSSIWEACLSAVLCLTADGREPQSVITEAVLAMRRALSQAIPLALGTGMNAPSDLHRTEAIIALSGWAAAQISFKSNPRLTRALRKESIMQGTEGASPYTELLKRLPSNIYPAWCAGGWHTLTVLRTQIAALVEHDITEQHSQVFRPKRSAQIIPQPLDRPTYEEIARKLDEEDQYVAWCIKQAELTPLEAQVARLKLQDDPVSEQAIADVLDRSLGSVKQAWLRARPKLQRVINQ